MSDRPSNPPLMALSGAHGVEAGAHERGSRSGGARKRTKAKGGSKRGVDPEPEPKPEPAPSKGAAEVADPGVEVRSPLVKAPAVSRQAGEGDLLVGARESRLLTVDLRALDSLEATTLAVFCASDVRPLAGVLAYIDWRVLGAVSKAIQSGFITGADGEVMLLPVTGRFGPKRLFFFGLGPIAQCDGAHLQRAARAARDVLQRAGATELTFVAPAARSQRSLETEFVDALDRELGLATVSSVLVEKRLPE